MIRKKFRVNNNIQEEPVRKGLNVAKKPFLIKYWASFTLISFTAFWASIMCYILLVKVEISSNDNYIIVKYKKDKKEPEFFSSLGQLPVKSADKINQPVTSIMIENSPDARPQSGLKDAEIVFEAIAEGGITRFVATYQVNKPQMIGPVRSLRPYYLDWITPFNASIAHVGGSQEALDRVRNGQHRDIDQMANGSFYWRSTDRYAPHNVYTNFDKLDTLNNKKGFSSSQPKSFSRQDEPEKDKMPKNDIKTIDLTINSQLYNVKYSYDNETNSYKRFMAGNPHLDREKGQITPKVVIAMMVDMSLMQDGVHNQIKTVGTDTAYIFQNGTLTKAEWHKSDVNEQIVFTDSNNKQIKLNKGQIWISAIPKNKGDVSWR